MNIRNALHKLTALALSVAMAVSMAPVSLAAETGINAISSSGEIITFEELAAEVTVQNVPIGTQKSELNLPKMLTATVLVAVYEEEPVLDSGEADSESDGADTVSGSAIGIDETDEPETDGSEGDEIASPSDAEEAGDSSEAEPAEETRNSADEITYSLPVTWASSPEYDGETASEYIFMPLLPEDVTLADGVELPAITVMVEEAAARTSGEITAFETMPDDLRWQNSTALEFPEMVDGIVAGEAAEIPVTWEADHDYDAEYPQRGLYVFTAVLGEGYGLADGVELPRITVYIPQTVGGRMARMAGGGTSDSPLEITTAAQLAEIATLVNARANGLELFLFNNADAEVTLKLQNDLDLSGYASGEGWTPIGNFSSQFRGTFNGGGNKITGLAINRDAAYQGLFGYVGTGGMVENLGLEGININGNWRVGGVAGYINGSTVKNCYSTGSVTGTGNVVGGVVGHIQTGTVENCYSTGRVSGVGAVGGVAGYIKDGTVKNCYSTSSVTGTGSDVGGVTGYVYGGNVQNCAALNPSVGGGSNTGRMAGSNNTGTLSGNIALGGMTVIQSGSPKATISDAQGLDGESKTAAEISATGFFETLFTSDTAWIYESGKLPGFGAAIDMPMHIVDGSDPNFRGAGTSENPFQISTPAQLAKLAELVNGAGTNAAYGGTGLYYKLQNGIDLSAYSGGEGWTPIGCLAYPFKGTFDGGSNKITGLTINRDADYQGLFGFIDIGGTVKNLGLEEVDISGRNRVGGVVGHVYTGTVENCYSIGRVSGVGAVGGVVGYIKDGTVKNCYSTGSVTGTGSDVGGVAGYVDGGGTVRNCYSTGSVTSTGYYVGGMVGIVGVSSHVENCAALNPSVSGHTPVGRVAGNNTGTLSGNIAFGDITVTVNGNPKDIASDAAGLDGESKTTAEISAVGFFETLFDSDTAWTYAEGKLPGLDTAIELPAHLLTEGAVSFEGAGTSENPYKISTAADLAKLAELVNTGTSDPNNPDKTYAEAFYRLIADIDLSPYGASNTGFNSGKGWIPIGNNPNAFKGIFDGNNKEISGLYINNSINDTGLFGYVEGGMFKNLSIVDVHIAGYNSAGGVAGYMDGGSVENCYVTGTVSVTGDYIGGMAGIVKGGCILKNSYTAVTVEGSSRVGGLAGYLENSSVANCYSTGNVSATSGCVGGVVGFISNFGSVRNCAALNPSVSGTLDIGRVAGWVDGATLSNNYAFSRVPGTWENKGSDAKDGANVTSQILFGGSFWTTAANWDTDPWDSTVWTFADGKLPTLIGLAGQSGEGGLYLTARDIQYATVATIDTIPYNGNQQLPSLTVTFDGETLLKDADYTLSITSANGIGTSAGTNAGEVTLTMTGIGSFYGTKTITYIIEPTKAQSITTAVNNVTMSAYEARSAVTGAQVVALASLPASVSVTTETGDTGTLPITWATSTAYNVKGTTYAVTGTLAGNGNIDANGITKSVSITVTPVTAVNPAFGDTLAVINSDSSATAAELGNTILPASGSITVGSQSVAYTIDWNGSETLDRTGVGNTQTFTGTISYTAPPAWLTLPVDTSVSRKVTVTDKTLVTIGGITTANKTYDGTAYAPTGTVTVSDGFPVNQLELLYESTDGTGYHSSTTPMDAGAYKLTISVPESNANYVGSEVFTFTIEKRQITLTADNKTVVKGDGLPALTYTVSNLAPGETKADALSDEPTLACPTFDGNTLGEYDIILAGGTAKNNYTITTRTNGTLTVAEQTYTVTFNLNGGTRTGGGELIQTAAKGSAATAPTVSRSSYTFTGWDKDFTNVTSNLTVSAGWSYSGGGGGSSSGGSSTTTTTTMPEKTPDQPITATVPVTATAGANGAANASIPDKVITDAIAKAQADARTQGKAANGISVGLAITMPKGATSFTATLTPSSLDSLVSAGAASLAFTGSPADVSFDLKALQEIRKQSSGAVTISITPVWKLSTGAQAMIGGRPVYDITVSYVKDGKTVTVSAFNGGIATISIPYTPATDEAPGYLYGVYVNASGSAQRIAGSTYDANAGAILISTGHLSVYGVGYTAPSAKFTDISSHWAKESIDYVVGRGLLSGTSDTTFSPNTAMTRGMLVTALGRLAGVDTKFYTTNSFTDVTASSAFRPYIEWAYKIGIIQGTGNGKFEPDRAVTREEIAVIFANYAKATSYTLPVNREASTYADASSIGSTYKTAVTAMQQAGIMMGGTGNKFNPKSSATRAEVSSMLHRYIKLTIDPATAQGWALNDAGQYLYYKDSKILSGTQTIGGMKYFFNTDGTLKTGWVKDGNNWRYYSSNIMLVGFWDIGANGNNKTYYFTKDGIMVAGKWLEIDGKWYYFYADGSLARSTKVDGYEVDANGVKKTK